MSCNSPAFQRCRQLGGSLVVLAVATSVFATAVHARNDPLIEGTWLNSVKIVSCTQPAMVIASFQSMTTYLRGGVLVEGGGPAAPPPGGVSRSPGHGIWEWADDRGPQVRFDHSGRRLPPALAEIRALIRNHVFDGSGRLLRVTEVLTEPTLFRGDNPDTPETVEPYYLSGKGTNRITTYNPNDGSVVSVSAGCNEAVSRKITFDDIPR